MEEVVSTIRLLLRKPEIHDHTAVYEHWARYPEITKYLTWRPHKSPEETRSFIQQCIKDWESETKYALFDQDYRGKGEIDGTKIVMPKNLKRESQYLKKKREERCRSRSGVEAVISHLKVDHRMLRNYRSGVLGDKVNTLMAAAAYNMKLWMIRQRESIFDFIRFLFFRSPILVLGYYKTMVGTENGDL